MAPDEGNFPPIDPQSVIDLVFTATAFSSGDERAQKLGEALFLDFLQALRHRHVSDRRASAYLDAIVPAIGSALRAFAVEKLNYKRDVLPLEELLKYESTNAVRATTALPMQTAGETFSRWATRTGIASIATASGLGAVAIIRPTSLWGIGALLLAFGTVVAIMSDWIGRKYRQWRTKQVLTDITTDLDRRWGEMYLRYEAILVDCLLQAIRAQETWYPHIVTFADGHLFPRSGIPMLPPPTTSILAPSLRSAVELVRELRAIATARMSIRPGIDKLQALESRLELRSSASQAASGVKDSV